MSYYVFQAHLCNSSRVKSLCRELLPTILQSKKNKERFKHKAIFHAKYRVYTSLIYVTAVATTLEKLKTVDLEVRQTGERKNEIFNSNKKVKEMIIFQIIML